MKMLLSGRRERRFHLQLSQVICFQSVKYGLRFVYYLCLGFNLRGRKKGMEKEKRSRLFQSGAPPCQTTF